MGCDIHGWVEMKDGNWGWDAVVNIDSLINRGYDAFAYLFGVRNYANFEALFEDRGIPEGASWKLRQDYEHWGEDAHSASYATLTEILAHVQPDGESALPDERIHQYELLPGGVRGRYLGKFAASNALDEEALTQLAETGRYITATLSPFPFGRSDDAVGTLYVMEHVKVKEIFSSDWELLFQLMEVLAQHAKSRDNVRLVVWFDN